MEIISAGGQGGDVAGPQPSCRAGADFQQVLVPEDLLSPVELGALSQGLSLLGSMLGVLL